MAEQTVVVAPASGHVSEGIQVSRFHLDTAEALRQARACLETSDRRLRRGDGRHADEILRLLQNATDLLECALFTEPRP